VDPRALANHYLAAGEVTQAAAYSARAARHVAESLAFERACQLYRISIQLRGPSDPELPRLYLGLADALANAGRGAEAAPLYLQACAGAEAAEVHRLRRRAMEEFFRSGHVAEGLAIARQVLGPLGLRIPPTPLRSALSLLFHRLRLKWRGLGFVERGGGEIHPGLLDRIDTLWSMAMGLGPTDLIGAADFQSRQLLLALEAGEPRRILRGLAHETALRSGAGVGAAAEVRQIHSVAVALAERLGDAESMARAQIGAGVAALAMGQWRSALQGLDQAVVTLQPCTGVAFERHLAQYYACQCAALLGDLRGAARRHEAQYRLARTQGDRLTLAALTTDVGYLLRAAEDDPGRALIELEEALEGWPEDRFLYTHFRCMVARVDLRLYEGNPGAALAQVDRNWAGLRRSLLMKAEGIRITCWELRARVDLAQGQADAARRWTRKLLAEQAPYGVALGLKNLGVLAARAGRRSEAADRLLEGELALRDAELHLHAECLRWARGGYLGGSSGEELRSQAEAWMRGQGIQNPQHMTRMLVPGLER
jgi:tetratricopeptide (TPR) repeat protein